MQARQANTSQGVPTPASQTITYSGKCLLRYGVGVKGTMYVGGTLVQVYGPGVAQNVVGGIAGPAAGNIAGNIAGRAAAVAGSAPGVVVSLTASVYVVLEKCKCKVEPR
jgi:hypothetical protein